MLKFNIKNILIGSLLFIILLMRVFQPKCDNVIVTKVISKIDTVFVPVKSTIFKKGNDIYHFKAVNTTLHDTIFKNVIIKNDSISVYIDTLVLNDSAGVVKITDTLYNNMIISRLFESSINNRIITKTITTIKEKPSKNQLYLGALLGVAKTNEVVNNLGLGLLLKTKRDKVYNVGIQYNNNNVLSLQAGLYWKIKLKK